MMDEKKKAVGHELPPLPRGVRATDGTDTAATGLFNATPVTPAHGTITFTAQPIAASTIAIDGTTWTYVAALTTGNQILIGASLAATLAATVAALQASTDANTMSMTYSANALVLSLLAAGANYSSTKSR